MRRLFFVLGVVAAGALVGFVVVDDEPGEEGGEGPADDGEMEEEEEDCEEESAAEEDGEGGEEDGQDVEHDRGIITWREEEGIWLEPFLVEVAASADMLAAVIAGIKL